MADHIDHPGAWEAARIGGKEAFMHRMGPEHVAALEQLLARTRDRAPDAVTRQDFAHPLIDELMQAAKAQLLNGYGAIIIAGLPMEHVSLENYTRIHWGLGTHLGVGAVQSAKGDRIGYVRNEPGSTRGYTTDVELRPHTDFHEIMSLAAFSRAESGGVSGLVSGLAIHNRIARERPDLLPALYEGFWHLSPGGRVSSDKVPVFSETGGLWSVYYHTIFQRMAADQLGTPIPPRLAEAMDLFNAYAEDPALAASFTLEPGEQLFWHNWTNLHSRTAFEDSEEHKRLLLRLWLNVPDGRQVVPVLAERAAMTDTDHTRELAGA
jgi:hypothetical protein